MPEGFEYKDLEAAKADALAALRADICRLKRGIRVVHMDSGIEVQGESLDAVRDALDRLDNLPYQRCWENWRKYDDAPPDSTRPKSGPA